MASPPANEPSDMGEDSIDLERLQAQIDLSMSFAQSLVSTWVQSAKLPSSTRQQEREKELQEYMRRPSRLGVGTAVTEVHSVSRETARLKGKLAGSKRVRVEGNQDPTTPTSGPSKAARDDDEDAEESRANAFRKKAKRDPFQVDAPHGKKKKQHYHEQQQIQGQQPHQSERGSESLQPSANGVGAKTNYVVAGHTPISPSSLSVSKAMAPQEQEQHDLRTGTTEGTGAIAESKNGSHDQGKLVGGGADELGSPTKRRTKKKKSKNVPDDSQLLSATTVATPSEPIEISIITTPLVNGLKDAPTLGHTEQHGPGPRAPMSLSKVKGGTTHEGTTPDSDSDALVDTKSPKEVEALLASSVLVSPTPSPRKGLGPSQLNLLKTPLLNLDGPPPDAEDQSDVDQGLQSPSSPKKRRRRKKKKRHSQGNGD